MKPPIINHHFEAYVLWKDGTWTVQSAEVTGTYPGAEEEARHKGFLAIKKRLAGNGQVEAIGPVYFCSRKSTR